MVFGFAHFMLVHWLGKSYFACLELLLFAWAKIIFRWLVVGPHFLSPLEDVGGGDSSAGCGLKVARSTPFRTNHS